MWNSMKLSTVHVIKEKRRKGEKNWGGKIEKK